MEVTRRGFLGALVGAAIVKEVDPQIYEIATVEELTPRGFTFRIEEYAQGVRRTYNVPAHPIAAADSLVVERIVVC
jgi:hypothetical protein